MSGMTRVGHSPAEMVRARNEWGEQDRLRPA